MKFASVLMICWGACGTCVVVVPAAVVLLPCNGLYCSSVVAVCFVVVCGAARSFPLLDVEVNRRNRSLDQSIPLPLNCCKVAQLCLSVVVEKAFVYSATFSAKSTSIVVFPTLLMSFVMHHWPISTP